MSNTLLVIAIVVGLGVIGSIAYVRYKIWHYSMRYFGTGDLMDGMKMQQEIIDSTPKSVSSMTKLELPRIQKDFPEFDWTEWKRICENSLLAYLKAKSSMDTAYASALSEPLREQIRQEIEAAHRDEIRDTFSEVAIHMTEISRYEKKPGICRIKAETSLQYLHSQEKNGISVLSRKMEQHVFISEIVYVQDALLAGEYATSVGTNCPNCGAPIKMLGAKVCQYCGTAVESVNIRVWNLHRISMES